MRLINKLFIKKTISFLILYLGFGLLGGNILTDNMKFTGLFFLLTTPYILMISISRFSVTIYLISSTYLFVLTYICLLSGMIYTLLPSANAMHYYGLPAPDNYIALAFCTLPFITLFVHMLHRGLKSLDEVAIPFIETRKKINLDTGEYYMNQKVNILRDATKKNIYDSKLEKFLERHAGLVYRIIMLTSGLGPVIPMLISRNFGQQPLNYFFLVCTAYFVWICSYFLPIVIQMTRTVLYIQKKHNIKLKLAYKDDKDVIIV